MASSRRERLNSTINLNLFSDEFLRKNDAKDTYIERTTVEAAYELKTTHDADVAALEAEDLKLEAMCNFLASRNAGLIENLNRLMQEEIRKASAAAFFNTHTFTGTT